MVSISRRLEFALSLVYRAHQNDDIGAHLASVDSGGQGFFVCTIDTKEINYKRARDARIIARVTLDRRGWRCSEILKRLYISHYRLGQGGAIRTCVIDYAKTLVCLLIPPRRNYCCGPFVTLYSYGVGSSLTWLTELKHRSSSPTLNILWQ